MDPLNTELDTMTREELVNEIVGLRDALQAAMNRIKELTGETE